MNNLHPNTSRYWLNQVLFVLVVILALATFVAVHTIWWINNYRMNIYQSVQVNSEHIFFNIRLVDILQTVNSGKDSPEVKAGVESVTNFLNKCATVYNSQFRIYTVDTSGNMKILAKSVLDDQPETSENRLQKLAYEAYKNSDKIVTEPVIKDAGIEVCALIPFIHESSKKPVAVFAMKKNKSNLYNKVLELSMPALILAFALFLIFVGGYSQIISRAGYGYRIYGYVVNIEIVMVLFFGVGLSFYMAFNSSIREQHALEKKISDVKSEQVAYVVNRLKDLENEWLQYLRFGFASYMGNIDEQYFHISSSDFSENSNLSVKFWVPSIKDTQLDVFSSVYFNEKPGDDWIWKLDSSDKRSKVARNDVYYPLLPLKDEYEWKGFELGADKKWAEIIKDVMRVRRTRITCGHDRFFSEYQDMHFVAGPVVTSLSGEDVVGVVVARLDLSKIFDRLLFEERVSIVIESTHEPCKYNILVNVSNENLRDESARSESIVPVLFLDEPVLLALSPTRSFIKFFSSNRCVYTLLAGLLMTFITTLFFSTIVKRRDEFELLLSKKSIELSKSREKLKSILDNSRDIIFSATSPDGKIVFMSDVVKDMLGFAPEEFYSNSDLFKKLVYQEDSELVGRALTELDETGSSSLEYRLVRKDGSIIWVRQQNYLLFDSQEKKYRVDGIITDISERIAAQEGLYEKNRQLDALFSQSLSGVFFIMFDEPVKWVNYITESADLDQILKMLKITRVNKAALEQYGAKEEQLVGLTLHDLFKHDVEQARRLLKSVFDTGRMSLETIQKKLNSSMMIVDGDFICIYDESNRIKGFFTVQNDITKRKQEEVELVIAKEAAERANDAKSDFLAKMSHELRTPMNSVIGFSNILLKNKKGNLTEKQLDQIGRINNNGIVLLEMINSILDASKIEAGKIKVNREIFDLLELIKETFNNMKGQLIGKNKLDYYLELPTVDSVMIKTDQLKLQQIIVNLIGNAVKFTEKGNVKVILETDEDNNPLAIKVKDTGPGIPSNKRKDIFKAFTQADDSATRKHGGTGLGLSISASLAELLGYRIKLESVEGEGSTFILDLQPDDSDGANT